MNLSRIDALIMEQEGLDKLTRDEIEGVQLEKLNALLAREHEREGFYRGLPQSLNSLQELAKLPFTTDEDLAGHGGELLMVSQAQVQRVLSDATSGTTGRAKRVFYTLNDCENTVRLFAAGLGELIYPGSTTMICMPFSGAYGLGELIAEAITRLGAQPLRLGTALSYGELAEAMETFRPDTYVGMPAALLSLLRVCGRGSLERALISGDACPRSVTQDIERRLGSRVFPHYGSREMGLAGAICCQAHEGMHLRENMMIAEIVDGTGRPLPEGETGELVITAVGMEAMPLIRYRTGDYTRFLPVPCPCGSQVRRLDDIARKTGSDILALDEALFSLPQLVDHRAEKHEGQLYIEALTVGDPEMEAISAAAPGALIRARRVSMEDGPLYKGKRMLGHGAY